MGKLRLQLLHLRLDFLGGLQGVRAGQLEHGQRDRRIAVEVAVHVVVLGPQFRALLDDLPVLVALDLADDVAQLDDFALRPGLDDDVVELLFAAQASLGLDHQLKRHGRAGGDRRLPEPAGGDLDVLLADGLDHVGGRHAQGGELLRIEPDAHAVVARAEERHVAHALDARQVVLHAERGVVAQVELVVVEARRPASSRRPG